MRAYWRELSLFCRCATGRRGAVAVEFALIVPILALMLAAAADFSLAFRSKALLAGAVSQGVQYAALAGVQVNAGAVEGIVRQPMSLPGGAVTVSAASCYCIQGPKAGESAACGASCPDGSSAGTFVTITARFTYAPILPVLSRMTNTVLTETATVRLK